MNEHYFLRRDLYDELYKHSTRFTLRRGSTFSKGFQKTKRIYRASSGIRLCKLWTSCSGHDRI